MKRMIEVRPIDLAYAQSLGCTHVVSVNSTSLEIINQCLRKAQYALDRGLRAETEGPALIFGQAIHKALETFYCTSISKRSDTDCLAVFSVAASSLEMLPSTDKRSIANGKKILQNYFNTYREDPWVIYKDQDGYFVERDFEFELAQHEKVTIRYFGTIDAIFQHRDTKELVLVDHKTTSSLGIDFYAKGAPNHQFTGYLLAAQKAFNLPVTSLMLNGIQVAKTMTQLARTFTTRSETDFHEFKEMVKDRVGLYMRAQAQKHYPMAGYPTCAMWGGCQYKEVCESPSQQRENVLQSRYRNATP